MDATNACPQLEDEIRKAHSLASEGRLDEAESAYRRLLENHPEETRILSTLGTIAFRNGNLAEARNFLEKSLRIDPGQVKAQLNLSTILFNLGDFNGALKVIDQSLAFGHPGPEIWNNRGIILSALGRHDDALHDLEKTLALNPSYVEAHYNKGSILQRIGLTGPAAASYQQVIDLAPNHNAARYSLAIIQASTGNHAQALDNLGQAISTQPNFVEAHIFRGRILFELGRLDEALADTENALNLAPSHVGALFQKGSILLQLGDAMDALACFTSIRTIAPSDTYNLLALGVARYNLKDYPGAIEAFDALIALDPNVPEAYNNKGLVLQELKLYAEAIAHYERSLALAPNNPDALYNQANALREQDAFEEALALYDTLLALVPGHLNGLKNKGATLDKLKKREEALAAYNQMIYLYPDDAEAYFNASTVLVKLDKPEQALNYANKAYKIDPENVDALYIRALVLMKFGLLSHAMADAKEALRLKPRHALANFIMGNLYDELKQPAEALKHLEVALAESENIEFLPGKVIHLRMNISDWRNFQNTVDRILALIDQGKPACQPFELQSKIDAPEYHKRSAEIFYDELFREKAETILPSHAPNQRIHVAYFSSDIGDHPVSNLMAGVFETHDRSKFEVTLFSLNNHADGARNRIFQACEHAINAEFMTDEEVVALARSLKVDIAVDLNGFTSKNRTGIFARRAAPLQLNYIGFLGTMGSDCYDYILADPVIAPFAHEGYFSEKIIHLPCYQANDDKLVVPATTQTRADFGLPSDAFVFCSFNANYKITPAMFATWMKILQLVPKSVLWLHCKREDAIANLRAEAAAQGIEGKRLIIAHGLPYLEHLARHRLADLFLDTSPYNAGATASNALYCGLPLITYCGKAFCSRYGASLLTALDLPELITASIDDYIALSVRIATDRAYHARIKDKLAENLKTQPLFNTRTFTTNLEKAYQMIHARHRQGLAPAHISLLDTPNA